MLKGSKKCQWRRLGGYDNCQRQSVGAVMWADAKGGAHVCQEHLEQAVHTLAVRQMSAIDCVLYRMRRVSHV